MEVIYKYLKNSNTGELVFTQEFKADSIKGIPVYLYTHKREKIGDNIPLIGFIEMSEKKFFREAKKLNPK